MRPHRLVHERCEAARAIPKQFGDRLWVWVGIDEDATDIEKHGARTALGVHAFRSFWYCKDPTADPINVVYAVKLPRNSAENV